jgi:hypothetical protein
MLQLLLLVVAIAARVGSATSHSFRAWHACKASYQLAVQGQQQVLVWTSCLLSPACCALLPRCCCQVLDSDQSMEVAGLAALSLGLVFASSCKEEVVEALITALMTR